MTDLDEWDGWEVVESENIDVDEDGNLILSEGATKGYVSLLSP